MYDFRPLCTFIRENEYHEKLFIAIKSISLFIKALLFSALMLIANKLIKGTKNSINFPLNSATHSKRIKSFHF